LFGLTFSCVTPLDVTWQALSLQEDFERATTAVFRLFYNSDLNGVWQARHPAAVLSSFLPSQNVLWLAPLANVKL
jgi:hypothetical protein